MRSRTAATACAALAALAAPSAAHAGKYDLQFLNLCKNAPVSTLSQPVAECSWVKRDGTGRITGVQFDADAESRYRSLMSELGVVMAPVLQTPADTLGIAGFQITAELGWTQISNDKPFWNGTEGVPVENPNQSRPSRWLGTLGAFVRKGIWLPVPAFEIGGGALNLLDSRMFALQAYAKLALHEGFHDWPLPSLAIRGSGSRVTGTDQVALTVGGFDVAISKQFSLAGTARFEPFAGWNYLWIDARSQVIDATPSCDAFTTQAASGSSVGAYCATSQAGTWDDLKGNFVFPNQDAITRNRFFVGAKIKFWGLALIGQWSYVPAGGSRDSKTGGGGAKDGSSDQQSATLSGGLDF